MHEYIRKLLYKDLSKTTTEKVLRQMRKLSWNEQEVRWEIIYFSSNTRGFGGLVILFSKRFIFRHSLIQLIKESHALTERRRISKSFICYELFCEIYADLEC